MQPCSCLILISKLHNIPLSPKLFTEQFKATADWCLYKEEQTKCREGCDMSLNWRYRQVLVWASLHKAQLVAISFSYISFAFGVKATLNKKPLILFEIFKNELFITFLYPNESCMLNHQQLCISLNPPQFINLLPRKNNHAEYWPMVGGASVLAGGLWSSCSSAASTAWLKEFWKLGTGTRSDPSLSPSLSATGGARNTSARRGRGLLQRTDPTLRHSLGHIGVLNLKSVAHLSLGEVWARHLLGLFHLSASTRIRSGYLKSIPRKRNVFGKKEGLTCAKDMQGKSSSTLPTLKDELFPFRLGNITMSETWKGDRTG